MAVSAIATVLQATTLNSSSERNITMFRHGARPANGRSLDLSAVFDRFTIVANAMGAYAR
jgi:hypothetical protein